MTMDPPLSAFLIVMLVLLTRLLMAVRCAGFISGMSVGPPGSAKRMMERRSCVNAVTRGSLEIGGDQMVLERSVFLEGGLSAK